MPQFPQLLNGRSSSDLPASLRGLHEFPRQSAYAVPGQPPSLPPRAASRKSLGGCGSGGLTFAAPLKLHPDRLVDVFGQV